MDRRLYIRLAVYAVLALAVLIVGYMVNKSGSGGYDRIGERGTLKRPSIADTPAAPSGTAVNGRQIVYLYFGDRSKPFLTAEERELAGPKEPVTLGRAIIEALIEGPQQELMPTLPQGAALRAFYLTQEGTAYVDMDDAAKSEHPGGSETELLTIYSIVNSLILNIPEIASVRVLINGTESTTLAGHIDLRSPYKANMLIVR